MPTDNTSLTERHSQSNLASDLSWSSFDDLTRIKAILNTDKDARLDEKLGLPQFSLQDQPGTHKIEITVNGTKRDFLVDVPQNYNPNQEIPVILAFNGLSQNASKFQTFTGLTSGAEKNGTTALVVYMDGIGPGGTFNNGEPPFDTTDDVKYVSAALDYLNENYNVDQSRLYAVGFSEGGSFVHALVNALPEKFAAIATVEGWMTGKETGASGAISELQIVGTKDSVVPPGGTDGLEAYGKSLNHGGPLGVSLALPSLLLAAVQRDGIYIESANYALNYYRKIDGMTEVICDSNNTVTVRKVGDSTYLSYRNPLNGTEVAQITVPDGTHAWPGSTDHSGDIPMIGVPDESFSATDEIISFLMRHSREE